MRQVLAANPGLQAAFRRLDPRTSQGLRPLYPCGIWESRKSGVRSQNSRGVCAEESADFFQHGGELFDIAIAELLGEDQKVTAFFDGPLGNIHEPGLVRFATA